MTALGTVTQYVNRTVDMSAYHGIQPAGDVRLAETLAPVATGGAIITGVQKVAQRFLCEFLRETGSTPFRPNDGTDFITEVRSGALRTQADVLGAFARGVSQVQAILQAEEADTDPPDERFIDAIVSQVFVSPGLTVIRFQIVTQAGSEREFIFPLRIPL